MKKIMNLVVSLTVISAVCAGVLAYVNLNTKGPIAEMKVRQEQDAVKAVMPASVKKVETQGAVYVGLDAAGKVAGYAAKGQDSGGYGGDIVLMVGFESDKRTLVCYKTLLANETPGLGMKLNTPEFSGQFAHKDAGAIEVVKGKATAPNAVVAITSATITSKAVCRAIQDAQRKL